MASRNSRKLYANNTFYHLYNRGVNKQAIFTDAEDYAVFLNLLKRYLDKEPVKDNRGREYPRLHEEVELVAFCLMPNHFHLLVYQTGEEGVKKLIKNVCGSYTTYFNKKHKRIGPLFQDRFKAVAILNESYLHHISRYIHLNPRDYTHWEFSSLPYYVGRRKATWVQPARALNLFKSVAEYETFLEDYEGQKFILDKLKKELADQ